jgi:pimeloyl-ACP methyl ester carboxylesterase
MTARLDSKAWVDNGIRGRTIRSYARKAGSITGTIIAIILAGLLGLLGVLLLWSYPGRPKPFVGEDGNPLPGSISAKIRINIVGVQQGMFIKSRDAAHPVLLYLHGGMPEYFLAEKYPTGLDEVFTMVWWEQRGSGLSYERRIPRETMTVEQFIVDTLDVTNYLRHRFGKEKIYLMGHSGGSFFGMQAAACAPELYCAYIGVAQMVDQFKSERLAYEHMLQQFREYGNGEMVRRLEAAPVTVTGGIPPAYLALRDGAMHRLGIGTRHDMKSVISGIFLPSLQNRDYTLREKVHMWRGKAAAGVSPLWDEMIATNLTTLLPQVTVPVYFCHGIYDYTCSYTEARAYFARLKAPLKGFYTFEQSAHSPIFEEPEKMMRIVQQDVLVGANSLADIR